jgi:hypothetical protein
MDRRDAWFTQQAATARINIESAGLRVARDSAPPSSARLSAAPFFQNINPAKRTS